MLFLGVCFGLFSVLFYLIGSKHKILSIDLPPEIEEGLLLFLLSSCSRTAARRRRRHDRRRLLVPSGSSCLEDRERRTTAGEVLHLLFHSCFQHLFFLECFHRYVHRRPVQTFYQQDLFSFVLLYFEIKSHFFCVLSRASHVRANENYSSPPLSRFASSFRSFAKPISSSLALKSAYVTLFTSFKHLTLTSWSTYRCFIF